MIEFLEIKDFVLIDRLTVDFSAGLNVLTGETGAGKSLFIGALSFLLGGKADVTCIRTGCHEASVSGSVVIDSNNTSGESAATKWLTEHGITYENNGDSSCAEVILRRVMRDNGRTGAWIGGTAVSRQELEEFTAILFDMHGQHEHQSLLKVTEHRRFLDDFAGITAEVASFTALYTSLAEKRKELQEFLSAEQDKNRKIELLSFAVQEITEAKLTAGEDAELEQEESRLSQFEKICTSMDQLLDLLSGPSAIVPSLKHGRQLLDTCTLADASLEPLRGRLESGYYELDDIADSLRRYRESLLFDPDRLEHIEERLSLIGKLKKKYGATIEDVISYGESCAHQLSLLEDFDSNKESLRSDVAQIEKQLIVAGKNLTQKRTEAAHRLETQIMEILSDLSMKGTVFSIQIQGRKTESAAPVCGPYGFDDIEFLISANKGEPLRPLAKIASGGELSRVMLAVKSILADVDETETLIFDEIDTGIGGEVALAVGAHLQRLATRKQIICITHQASIAARADNHIKIKKNAENNITRTSASLISGDLRTEEIARMLAGDAFGETALLHAAKLLETYGGSER